MKHPQQYDWLDHNILTRYIPDLEAYLSSPENKELSEKLKMAERSNRPVGSKAWLQKLEQQTGYKILPRKPGPKTSFTEANI